MVPTKEIDIVCETLGKVFPHVVKFELRAVDLV